MISLQFQRQACNFKCYIEKQTTVSYYYKNVVKQPEYGLVSCFSELWMQ